MSLTKVCFFGASTTEGLGDEARLGWPGRVLAQRKAESQHIVSYNLGVRGQTTSMMLARLEAECKSRLISDARSVIFLSFGLNDIAEVGGIPRMPRHRTLKNVEAMVEVAQTMADVLWMGPAPVHDQMMPITYANGNVFSFSNAMVSELNDEYNAIATKQHIPYLDAFTPLIKSADYLIALERGDGLHPNGQGYAAVAELINDWASWQSVLQNS